MSGLHRGYTVGVLPLGEGGYESRRVLEFL